MEKEQFEEATRLIVTTRSSQVPATALPPVYHASTIFFDDIDEYEEAVHSVVSGEEGQFAYGTAGTPTTIHLSSAISCTEGQGHDCRTALLPSGKHAVVATFLAFLSKGDHLLVSDAVYGPTRIFAEEELARFGIEVDFFDPHIDPATLMKSVRATTRMIYMESPGTMTFEVIDVPGICAAARERNILVAVDNAWGSPFFGKPFDWGVDISVLPLTKFWNGHSDLVMGAVVVLAQHWDRLWRYVQRTSPAVTSDDAYLVLRGSRTMALRLKQHEESGLALAHWLEQQDGVADVLHPALPSSRSHALWSRDFSGSCGLFSIALKTTGDKDRDLRRAKAFCNSLQLFRIGGSWGGIESMAIVGAIKRSARGWEGAPLIRLFAGLEDLSDLREDLARGLRAADGI